MSYHYKSKISPRDIMIIIVVSVVTLAVTISVAIGYIYLIVDIGRAIIH